MTPTPEQQAIIEAAKTTTNSLLVNALAGAAKTSTLVMICAALPVQPILSLAFNKRIAEEMKKRLPSHVQSATLNSVGHKAWAQATGKRLTLSVDKVRTTVKAHFETLSRTDKAEAWEQYQDLVMAIRRARIVGYVPAGKFPSAHPLISREDFLETLEEEPSPFFASLLDAVLTSMIKESFAGNIDFDDQLYMPTIFGATWPRFPLVLIDEAQDLSPLNHAMLEKLVTKRLIAVGDPYQSIYGFRGSVSSGMSRLRARFNMTELTLSVSFRCPQKVVKQAWRRVPHMRWFDGAPEGKVETLSAWNASDIPDGAAVICRNNAPLFRLALNLLRSGRGVQLVGSDLGPQLIKTLKKLGPESMNRHEVEHAIAKWEAERLAKSRSKGAVSDKADCLRVFASFGATLSEAIAYAEHLFASAGPIQLMSGHKSKGLEFDTVYHLDSWRIPSSYATSPDSIEQEHNIEYVINTRAKRELYFVNMEDFT